jgi:TnpA family transposase
LDADLIERNWDDILRLASSIRHGTVSASLIMRKLASYPQQNQIARALREIGRLERTVFILDYFLDEALRRRVRTGLNKGEALQALARALFFGRSGEFRDHHLEDQMHRASCLMMLISSISAWNAVYIDKALAHLRSIGEAVSEEYLSHISPLAWEHINFLGRYSFDLDGAHPLHALRDLRL